MNYYAHDDNTPQQQQQGQQSHTLTDTTNEPMQNYDGTHMCNQNGELVYKSQFLSTHPLWSDCKERVGYAGKKFTYVSGDGVIRTMNAIFGHGGWSSQILNEKLIQSDKDERNGRWYVGYLATVRVTLLNGVSHEDVGSGEGINDSKIKAHEKALKSAITDAMKRAARHFGERLGNALYVKGNGIRTAPKTNRDALMELERRDALNLFGDQKMAVSLRNGMRNESSGGNNNNNNNNGSNGHQSLEKNESAGAGAALASTSTTSLSIGVAASRSINNNVNSISNNINTNRSMMQTSAARPTPHPPQNPSPILSRGRKPLLAQQHQVQQVQVGNVNNNLTRGNQQNSHPQYQHQQQQQQQHQQQQAMAPPPRPMYKPQVISNTNTTNNNNSSQHQHQHTGVNNMTSSSDSMKRGLAINDGAGGDATAKRQKLNPYNRLSV